VLPLATVAADDDSLRWCRALALRAGASVVLAIDAREGAGLAERAAALRARHPRLLLAVAREQHEAVALAVVVEAARVATLGAEDAARVIAAVVPEAQAPLRAAAAGLPFERTTPPHADGGAAVVRRLRELRGREAEALARVEAAASRTESEDVLICEIDGEGARAAVRTRGAITAAELDVGLGPVADALVRRCGARAVRRWLFGEALPDTAALRDRIANLARFAVVPPRPLELALLREALRALAAAMRAELSLTALDRPRVVCLGGAFARIAPAEAAAVLLDALEPRGLARIEAGDREAALVVVPEPGRRARPLRVADERGERDIHQTAGALTVVPTAGRAVVHAGPYDVVAGTPEVGVVIDARGRPLAIPERDGERQPLLRRWAAAWP
jgi:hypothetical protein